MSQDSFQENTLKLNRFNGTESYSILEAACILFTDEKLGPGMTIRIDETEPVSTLEDTAGLAANPEAAATLFDHGLRQASLVGQSFSIPTAYDERIGDHATWFYYVDHMDLDENQIKIVDSIEQRIRIHWTGTTDDVNFYDGSKPRTRF